MIFVTSDLHFNHNKDFIYQARGFSSIQEHDEALISRWNETVSDEDEVYILGDVGMGKDKDYVCDCINRLNGAKYLVAGNHDSYSFQKKLEDLTDVEILGYAFPLVYKKKTFFLCHYPTRCSFDVRTPRTISLCGHTHSKDMWSDWDMFAFHCEVDAHDMRPVALDEVMRLIREKQK